MKKLLKNFGMNTVQDYRNMVLDQYNNGNRKDAKTYFMQMPKMERISFLKWMIFEYAAGGPAAGSIMFFNSMFGL